MDPSLTRHRAWSVVPLCALLLTASCSGEPSRPAGPPARPVAQAEAAVHAVATALTGIGPCPSASARSWTVRDPATRGFAARGWLGDAVVGRAGTVTLAWTGESPPRFVRTVDEPPAPGDPQEPPGPATAHDPSDGQVSAAFSRLGGHLGVDATDALTVMWRQDLLPPGPDTVYTEFYDLVVSDRPSGGGWSGTPSVVGTGGIYAAQLAVNASGAAVVAWDEYDGAEFHVYVAHRLARDTAWTPARQVPSAAAMRQVGIDDAGRVLLVYKPQHKDGIRAIRRTRRGEWGAPQRLGGPMAELSGMAVGANGAAVVAYTRPAPETPHFTVRMSPVGTWGAPVRQPVGRAVTGRYAVDMDARGRALYTWWDGTDLVGRWSRPDGQWRKPCVLARDVSGPSGDAELDPKVVVNRRGDALVAWRAKGRATQLWARYRRAHQGWTKPVEVTRAGRPPRSFTVAIGDRGDTAIAWTTRNTRQVHLLRASPAP